MKKKFLKKKNNLVLTLKIKNNIESMDIDEGDSSDDDYDLIDEPANKKIGTNKKRPAPILAEPAIIKCEPVDITDIENYYWFLFGKFPSFVFGGFSNIVRVQFENKWNNSNENIDNVLKYYGNNLADVLYSDNSKLQFKNNMKKEFEFIDKFFELKAKGDFKFDSCFDMFFIALYGSRESDKNIALNEIRNLVTLLHLDKIIAPSFGFVNKSFADSIYNPSLKDSKKNGISMIRFILYMFFSLQPYIMATSNNVDFLKIFLYNMTQSKSFTTIQNALFVRDINSNEHFYSTKLQPDTTQFAGKVCHPAMHGADFNCNILHLDTNGYTAVSVSNTDISVLSTSRYDSSIIINATDRAEYMKQEALYYYFDVFNLKNCKGLIYLLKVAHNKDMSKNGSDLIDKYYTKEKDFKGDRNLIDNNNQYDKLFCLLFTNNPNACYAILCGIVSVDMTDKNSFIPKICEPLYDYFSRINSTISKIIMFNLLLINNYEKIGNINNVKALAVRCHNERRT